MKVSIVIPTMNRERTIIRAITAAVNQTYDNFEVLIIDNNSDDNTKDLIYSSFQHELSTGLLIYHRFDKRVNISSNWNRCLNLAKGAYLKFLFSDDEMDSNCVKLMVERFKYNKNLGIVSSPVRYIFEGEVEPYYIRHYQRDDNTKKAIAKSILSRNSIGAPTCLMFNNELIKKYRIRFKDNRVACDIMFMVELLKYSEFDYINKPLSTLYISTNTETSNLKETSRWVSDNIDSKEYMISLYEQKYGYSYVVRKIFKSSITIYSHIALAFQNKTSENFIISKKYMVDKGYYSRVLSYMLPRIVNNKILKRKLFRS